VVRRRGVGALLVPIAHADKFGLRDGLVHVGVFVSDYAEPNDTDAKCFIVHVKRPPCAVIVKKTTIILTAIIISDFPDFSM